ncbi:MAG: hypothetical protein R2757_16805 [Draconibacterium sp.]
MAKTIGVIFLLIIEYTSFSIKPELNSLVILLISLAEIHSLEFETLS